MRLKLRHYYLTMYTLYICAVSRLNRWESTTIGASHNVKENGTAVIMGPIRFGGSVDVNRLHIILRLILDRGCLELRVVCGGSNDQSGSGLDYARAYLIAAVVA
jgi:hypothetical protein